MSPSDAFFIVFFLLILEHMLIEIVLKMFIGVVDAELFKTENINIKLEIDNPNMSRTPIELSYLPIRESEIFKTEYVQNSNRIIRLTYSRVRSLQNRICPELQWNCPDALSVCLFYSEGHD